MCHFEGVSGHFGAFSEVWSHSWGQFGASEGVIVNIRSILENKMGLLGRSLGAFWTILVIWGIPWENSGHFGAPLGTFVSF